MEDFLVLFPVHKVKSDQELVRIWTRFGSLKVADGDLTDNPFCSDGKLQRPDVQIG